MEEVWTILGMLAWIAVLGGIAYLVFAWIRRGRTTEMHAGIGTPRRFYFYWISFVALMMLASGVLVTFSTLLDELFGGLVMSRSATTKLATGLALVIVGAPLWGFHWRFVQRTVSTLPVERHTILRSLYLYATLGVALGFMAFSGVRLIEFALRVRDLSGLDPAALVVWGLIWAYHWNVVTSGGPESTLETRGIRRLYQYLASAMGVAMLATGVGGILYLLLQEGYSAAFSNLVLEPTPAGLGREALRSSAALALVGCAIWWSHWLRFAGADHGSVLRWLYLFIAAIGGGAVTAQVGFGLALYEVISWILREPDSLASPFENLPAALATAVVGIAMWRYFRHRMDSEAEGDVRVLVRQVNDYLLAGMGLVVLAIATASVFDTSIRLLTEGFSRHAPRREVQWRFRVALILTLAAVGLPAWWRTLASDRGRRGLRPRDRAYVAPPQALRPRSPVPRTSVSGRRCERDSVRLLARPAGRRHVYGYYPRPGHRAGRRPNHSHHHPVSLDRLPQRSRVGTGYRDTGNARPQARHPADPTRRRRPRARRRGSPRTVDHPRPVVRPRRLRPISRLRGSLSRRPGHRLSPGKSPAPHPRTLRPTRHLPRLTEPIRLLGLRPVSSCDSSPCPCPQQR